MSWAYTSTRLDRPSCFAWTKRARSNSKNAWTLNNNQVLNIFGNLISNAGKMTMNSTGNVTELLINSPLVTLGGGGTLTMSNNANNCIFAMTSGDTLVNQETIQGAGNIGNGRMTLVNSGIINANQSAGMTINPNNANATTPGVTNTGTIEATSGATLTLSDNTQMPSENRRRKFTNLLVLVGFDLVVSPKTKTDQRTRARVDC
jgi:hypothetical protein